MIILKLILFSLLILIFYQDYKDRMVHWILFPLVGIASGVLYYTNTLPELFLLSVVLNLSFVLMFLLIIKLTVTILFKKKFFDTTGLGDVLMFLCLAFTFSSYSFYMIFSFGLIFTFVVHVLLKRFYKNKFVPTAGYMSLFFAFSYVIFWSGINSTLYAF